jgi:hypothetical protein
MHARAPDTENQNRPRTKSRAIGVALVSSEKSYATKLIWALRYAFLFRKFGYSITFVDRASAEIAIYAFCASDLDDPSFPEKARALIVADPAPTKIFLERPTRDHHGPKLKEAGRRNTVVARLAEQSAGYVLPLMSKFLRWNTERLLAPSGQPTRRGYNEIAQAIAKYVDLQVVRRNLAVAAAASAAPDGAPRFITRLARRGPFERALQLLAGFRALPKLETGDGAKPSAPDLTPEEILSGIAQDSADLPHALRGGFDRESIRFFLRNKLFFANYPAWGRIAWSDAIDWSMAGPNRSWQAYFLGLEFLNPIFNYLIAAANEKGGKNTAAVATFLREKNIDDDALLARAAAIVASFIEENPPHAPRAQRAWHEGTVSRRLKNLLLFLLCAKHAAARGHPVETRIVKLAFASISDSIAFLRSDSVYIPAGNHGVRQDLLLIDAGLMMQNAAFGREILQHGLGRLIGQQLDGALSSDGVWLENSFGYHCMVMRQLAELAEDLKQFGVAPDPRLMDAIGRMSVFAEGLIKCNGDGPLIGDTEPKSYESSLRAARAALSVSGDRRRSKTTYHFPDGGYFASHTGTQMDCEGSSLILTASLRNAKHKQADDLSIIFSHGATDLLVDGGTYNKETSDKVRNAARFDPATHNSYRIDGKGYTIGTRRAKRLVAMDEIWEGDGWAACLASNDAYEDGQISRLVIHLKQHNALIVFDQIKSRKGARCEFEQFWHIAPQFARAPENELSSPLIYSSDSDGFLLAAFDGGEAALAEGFGGKDDPLAWLMISGEETVPTPYLRRAKTLRLGQMASLFQWSPKTALASVALEPFGDGARIVASGAGFTASFSFERGNLACLSLSAC